MLRVESGSKVQATCAPGAVSEGGAQPRHVGASAGAWREPRGRVVRQVSRREPGPASLSVCGCSVPSGKMGVMWTVFRLKKEGNADTCYDMREL